MVELALLGVVIAGLIALAWREDVIESGRSLTALTAAAAVAFAGFAWWAAETPLGIGDGVVPTLEGRTSCDSEVALEKRGLRWRYDGVRPTGVETRADAGEEDSEPTCDVDVVLEQRPAPDTDLGERGVVRIVTSCSKSGGCA